MCRVYGLGYSAFHACDLGVQGLQGSAERELAAALLMELL